MLGAQFNLDILREIFTILKSHFIHQNMPIANILGGIVKNPQMVIVSAMMNTEDKLGITKFLYFFCNFNLIKCFLSLCSQHLRS